MTETEWMQATDPEPMLEFLLGKTSERKVRLFAVACWRRIWHLLTDERSRMAVEVAELIADGHPTPQQLLEVFEDAAFFLKVNLVFKVVQFATGAASWAVPSERPVHPALLRDIIGNPFRLVSLDPAWLSWNDSTVVKLAQAIYNDRAFDRLPILADALEEAGCQDQDILGHCRSGDEHVRGCWLIDALLGKS